LSSVGLGEEKGGSLASALCKEKQRAAMATLGEFVFGGAQYFQTKESIGKRIISMN
jgi:hypothetical protein